MARLGPATPTRPRPSDRQRQSQPPPDTRGHQLSPEKSRQSQPPPDTTSAHLHLSPASGGGWFGIGNKSNAPPRPRIQYGNRSAKRRKVGTTIAEVEDEPINDADEEAGDEIVVQQRQHNSDDANAVNVGFSGAPDEESANEEDENEESANEEDENEESANAEDGEEEHDAEDQVAGTEDSAISKITEETGLQFKVEDATRSFWVNKSTFHEPEVLREWRKENEELWEVEKIVGETRREYKVKWAVDWRGQKWGNTMVLKSYVLPEAVKEWEDSKKKGKEKVAKAKKGKQATKVKKGKQAVKTKEDDDLWEVEAIVAETEDEYEIKWATDGKGRKWENTMEPKENVLPEAVREWEDFKRKEKMAKAKKAKPSRKRKNLS